MKTLTPGQIEIERKKFEPWYINLCHMNVLDIGNMISRFEGGNYRSSYAENAWLSWQARASISLLTVTNDTIREVFMKHGFTIKEGQTDLKDYVYAAANELLARASMSAPVPEGFENIRAFAEEIIDYGFEGDLEGCSIQDIAERHGLLVQKMMNESCGEGCSCAENADFPVNCYRKTELLKAAPQTIAESVNSCVWSLIEEDGDYMSGCKNNDYVCRYDFCPDCGKQTIKSDKLRDTQS